MKLTPGESVGVVLFFFDSFNAMWLRIVSDFCLFFYEPLTQIQIRHILQPRDRSVWDDGAHQWVEVPGTYSVLVGSSSRDIRANGTFEVSPSSLGY